MSEHLRKWSRWSLVWSNPQSNDDLGHHIRCLGHRRIHNGKRRPCHPRFWMQPLEIHRFLEEVVVLCSIVSHAHKCISALMVFVAFVSALQESMYCFWGLKHPLKFEPMKEITSHFDQSTFNVNIGSSFFSICFQIVFFPKNFQIVYWSLRLQKWVNVSHIAFAQKV